LSVAVSTSVIAALWSGTEGNSRQLAQAAQNSLLLVPNDIALVAVIAPFCLAEVTLKSAFIWRCVGLLGLFGGIVASVVLSSRTAFIAQIVAIACMTGRSVGWRSKGFWCGLIGTLVVAIAIDSIRGFALFDKFIGSTGTRGSLWVAAIEMFIDAPLFGHGPHSFGELWREYLARARFPLIFPVDREAMYWPHNLFLELLSEFGIFGLTVFMLLTGRAIAASWSLSNVSQLEIAKLARPLFVALVSFLVAASLELTLQRVWVVNFWFALLALVEGLRLTASVATRSREV
jgi:O-antigen ligase